VLINSRRLISAPKLRRQYRKGSKGDFGRAQSRLCAATCDAGHVAVGSLAEVELADADFRFTPESRHSAGGPGCPLGAKK